MFDHIKGRPLTATLIVCAGITSAAFNVFGAFQLFNGPAAYLFAFCILCMEGIAIVALTHIVTDWNNNNYLKAAIGSLIFAGIVVGCAMSGKQAFHIISIDVEQSYAANQAKIVRMQTVADEYFAEAKSITDTDAKNRKLNSAEIQQSKVDRLKVETEKSAPPPKWTIFLFLAIFELVKSTGRYALAVESSKKWSLQRRRLEALKDKAKIEELSNVVKHPKAA